MPGSLSASRLVAVAIEAGSMSIPRIVAFGS
jgi:hypothetical protein